MGQASAYPKDRWVYDEILGRVGRRMVFLMILSASGAGCGRQGQEEQMNDPIDPLC